MATTTFRGADRETRAKEFIARVKENSKHFHVEIDTLVQFDNADNITINVEAVNREETEFLDC
jgi:hypothetical protein